MYNIEYNDTKILNNKNKKEIAKNLDTIIKNEGDCKKISCSKCPIFYMIGYKGFTSCVNFIMYYSKKDGSLMKELFIICQEIKSVKEKGRVA